MNSLHTDPCWASDYYYHIYSNKNKKCHAAGWRSKYFNYGPKPGQVD